MFQNQRLGLKGWWTCLYSALVALACWWPDFASAQPTRRVYLYIVLPPSFTAEDARFLADRVADHEAPELERVYALRMPNYEDARFGNAFLLADVDNFVGAFVSAFTTPSGESFLRNVFQIYDPGYYYDQPFAWSARRDDFPYARDWFSRYLNQFAGISYVRRTPGAEHIYLGQEAFLHAFDLRMAEHYLSRQHGATFRTGFVGRAVWMALEYLPPEDLLLLGGPGGHGWWSPVMKALGWPVPRSRCRGLPFVDATAPLFDAFEGAVTRSALARRNAPAVGAAAPQPPVAATASQLPGEGTPNRGIHRHSRVVNAPGISAAESVSSSSFSSSSSSPSSGPASLSCSCCPGGNHIQRHH